MDGRFVEWLVFSDAGMLVRVGIGVSVFLTLALWDLFHHGNRAQRWREYTFLLVAALIGMAYGGINEQITTTISWEYFYYGKGLAQEFDYRLPVDWTALRLKTAWLGIRAGWTPGLLFGVALLVANNPWRDWPRIPHRRLYRYLLVPLAATAGVSVAFGLAGRYGFLGDGPLSDVHWDEVRRLRFMATWGTHLGAYVGGMLGTVATVARILLVRRRLFQSARQTEPVAPRGAAKPWHRNGA